jgi:hypothetical protein
MRRAVALVLSLAAMLVASVAAAEPFSIAAGVNAPFRWGISGNDAWEAETNKAIAGSLHVGFGGHHAIRATLSSFPYADNIGGSIVGLLLNPDAESSLKQGRVNDVGAGYQWFPRRLWDGPVLEAGLLRRTIDGIEDYRFSAPEHIETHAVGYAARGLVGWSWLIANHVYVATAAGLAIGRYSGTETTLPSLGDDMSEQMTGSFTRWDTTPEFYLRIGGAVSL